MSGLAMLLLIGGWISVAALGLAICIASARSDGAQEASWREVFGQEPQPAKHRTRSISNSLDGGAFPP
jgi:hypothetical protein